MKLLSTRLMPLLALTAGALLMTPNARAATAANGDILLGVRATGGQGSTKTFVINLGQASALAGATTPTSLGNIGADLTTTFGSDWNTRSNVLWGAAGTIGSFSPIGTDPAKTVFGTRAVQSPWLRQNDSSHGAATTKLRALSTAFNGSSSAGVTASNAVVQTITDTNSWASYQPGGTTANSGPAPGSSFAFFNPAVETSFGSGVAGANLHFYRVKPATTGAELDTPGDYLGVFSISSSGNVTFTSVAAFAAGSISLSSAVYSVDQGSDTVALTLNRTGGSAPASVTLNTNDGTVSTVPPFSAAVAGTDYIDLAGAATTVAFAEGENTKTVNVTLIPKTAATTPNKRFTATLSAPTGTATLGATSTATIRIIAGSGASPTLKIVTPAGVLDSGAWPYMVKGTAGAALGVDYVQVSLNGGAPVLATLGAATSNTSVPWSLNIEPVAGLNTIVATVFDLSGSSASVRRVFTFTRRYVLTLTRIVPSGVAATPDSAGAVALSATPLSGATALVPTTANTNPKTANVVPGTTVKLTATAKTGYLFSHWNGVPAGASTLGNVTSFVMPVGDPTISAVFVANTFAPTAGAGNAFFGLLNASAGTTPSNATEGFLTGTLTPGTAGFTGKVFIDGVSQGFTATFFGNGSALFTVGTAKQTSLSFGGKTLTLSFVANAITGTVTKGSDTSTGVAARAIYSSTNKVPAALLNSAAKGFYTVGFPSKAQTPSAPASTYPQGDGFGTLSVTDLGVVSLSGTLADGTAITGSSALVAGNACPIFVQLTTPGAATTVKGGSFGGVLTFDATPADSDVSGTNLFWFRPAVTAVSTPAAAALATNIYTAGWPGGIEVDAVGALYSTAMTAQTSIGAATTGSANAQLMFTDGKLAPAITKGNLNITGNAVNKIPSTDTTYTLTLATATGGFSGTFTPNWPSANPTVKPAYKGILIQKGLNKGGYGYFLSNATGDLDPESGGVTLSKKP